MDFLFDCGLVGPDDVSTEQDLPRAVRKVSSLWGTACLKLFGFGVGAATWDVRGEVCQSLWCAGEVGLSPQGMVGLQATP